MGLVERPCFEFQLVRGGLVVGRCGPFDGPAQEWHRHLEARSFDGSLELPVDDEVGDALVAAIDQEHERWRRSRTKQGGNDCRIRFIEGERRVVV